MMDNSEGAIAKGQLLAFVNRVERLHEEKKAVETDIAEIYREAKGQGFDVKILKEVIRARRIEEPVRREQETVFNLYMDAIFEAEQEARSDLVRARARRHKPEHDE